MECKCNANAIANAMHFQFNAVQIQCKCNAMLMKANIIQCNETKAKTRRRGHSSRHPLLFGHLGRRWKRCHSSRHPSHHISPGPPSSCQHMHISGTTMNSYAIKLIYKQCNPKHCNQCLVKIMIKSMQVIIQHTSKQCALPFTAGIAFPMASPAPAIAIKGTKGVGL